MTSGQRIALLTLVPHTMSMQMADDQLAALSLARRASRHHGASLSSHTDIISDGNQSPKARSRCSIVVTATA